MSALDNFISGMAANATSSAAAAAEDAALAKYEQAKPLIYFLAFLAATIYLFYFLPRFRLPWSRV